ncbi:Uncharacterised protein [Mycobacterium tuberculosis]|nr:Uncharacterised protein [Mycobacterium tuberculosis]
MSCSAGLSVSLVRYSVRNCWSTEMPNRYSLVAPNGMPSVTTVNAETKSSPPSRAHQGKRRYAQPEATSPARQPT